MMLASASLGLFAANPTVSWFDAGRTDKVPLHSASIPVLTERSAPDSPQLFSVTKDFSSDVAQAEAKSVQRKKLGKRSVKATTISELAGDYVMTSASCVGYGTTGCAVTITPIAGKDSILIENFWSSGMTVKAAVNLTAGTISIPSQYLYTHATYGPMDLSAVTTNGVPLRNDPIEGTINEDGTISIDTWWCVAVNSGDQKDEIVDANRATLIERSNGTMSYTMKGKTYTFGIVATQDVSNVLKVKNFANRGNTLDITLNGDRGGLIPSQTVYKTSAGTYVSVGNPKLNTADQLIEYTPAIPLEIAPADVKRAVNWKEWTIYLPNKSFVGLIDNGVVNTSFDLQYPPQTSGSLTGDGSQANPYKVGTLSDMIILANMVNTDTDQSGKMAYNNQVLSYARSLEGKYVEMTADIDMSGYRFSPIGWDLSHRFCGTFDGKGHTISNLIVEGTGLTALFGVADTTSVIKNIIIKDAKVKSNGSYYAGTVAGFSYGTIDNCQAVNPKVEQMGMNAGGIVGVGNIVSNCSVTNGWVYTQLSFAGGIAGQINTAITNCNAENTYVMTSASVSADPRYDDGACVGGIVASLLRGTATNCWFSGTVDGYSMGKSVYAGGIAGVNQFGVIDGCFAAVMLRGIGSGSVNGGVAGWVSGTVKNSYSTGLVDCINSYYTGGITGRLSAYGSTNTPEVLNCYTTAQVYAEKYNYDSATEMRETIGKVWPGTKVNVANVYFDNQITNFTSQTGGVSNADMVSGNPLTGLDANVWKYTKNSYPRLSAIAESQGALQSASAFIMPTSATTLANVNGNIALAPLGKTEYFLLNNGELSKTGHFSKIEGNELVINDELKMGNDTIVSVNNGNSLLYFVKIAPAFLDGEGTAESPYLLKSKADIMALQDATSGKGLMFADTYFKFANDIDMENDETFLGLSNSTTTNRFAGVIDGAGFALHNLKMMRIKWTTPPSEGKLGVYDSKETVSNVAFVVRLGATGVIKNLTIADDCAFGGLGSIASIASDSYGTIENCRNYAPVTALSTTSGGIVAKLNSGAKVLNCYNAGNVQNGYQAVGGITGAGSGFTISGCVNTGTLEAKPLCSARNETSTVFKYVAGIGGNLTGTYTIENCVDYGHSYAFVSTVGSIVGRAIGTATLTNNIALGTLECPDVVALGMYGGELAATAKLTNNVWDGQLLPWSAAVSNAVDGATPLSTDSLISGKVLKDFDPELWSFDEGMYPTLKAFANEAAVIAARKAYFKVAEGQTVANLKSDATLPVMENMTWELAAGSEFKISESKLIVPAATTSLISGKITANFGKIYSKPFNLSVLPRIPLNGEGTEKAPYQINNANDWLALAKYVEESCAEFAGQFVAVTADVDFKDVAFAPVAFDGKTTFAGTLDGGNHTLKNINVNTALQNYGPIGILGETGIIKNLTIQGSINATNSYIGGFVGKNYGTIDNCVSEVTITTTKPNVGGFIGQGLGGSVLNSISRAVINTSTTAVGGFTGYASEPMTYTNCTFEGEINSTSTTTSTLNYGGFVGSSWPSVFTNCQNKGKFSCTFEKANGIAGFVGYANGVKGVGVYTFTDCANYSDISAGYKLCGFIASLITTAGQAPVKMVNCVNYGNITSGQTVAWTAGLVGQAVPNTVLINCRNLGDITSAGTTVGGLIGSTGGTFSAAEPLLIDSCYNTGKITSGGTYAAGLIASGTNFQTIRNSYNTGDVSGTMYVGGLMGTQNAVNLTVENCWNSGNIVGTGGRIGGLVGNVASTSATANLKFTGCFNTGSVSTTSTLQGTSTAAATMSGYAIGGLSGYSAATYENCYNMGSVKGVSRVGGLVGDPNTSKKLAIKNCYNAGKVIAPNDTCGAIVGINTANGKLWVDGAVVNTYYTTDCCESTLPLQGESKTVAELCAVKLGEGFVSVGDNCFPVIKALAEVDEALLYAGQPIFADGDNAAKVTKDFVVGTPEGVKWTMSPAEAKISEGKVTFPKPFTGKAQLIATIGELERVIDLNLVVESSSVKDVFAGRTVESESYYTPAGVRVAKPEVKDGQIYIVIVRYSDGTTDTIKLRN